MSNIADLKELSSSVDFWGTTTGFNSDRLCEILAFAVNSVEKMESAERERDEYAEGERLKAVKNVELQDEIYGLKAEIARRDAAAGDFRKLFTCSGCGAEGLDQPLESRCHCCIAGAHWVEGKLYTAAPPAVLPPEMERSSMFDRITEQEEDPIDSLDLQVWGYNLCLKDIKGMGAQQQKVVELPEPVKWPEIPFKYFSEEQVFSMLDAAGVKWEVRK